MLEDFRYLSPPIRIPQGYARSHSEHRRHLLCGDAVQQAGHGKIRPHTEECLIDRSSQFISAYSAGKTLVRQNVQPTVKADAEQPLHSPFPEVSVRQQLERVICRLYLRVSQLFNEICEVSLFPAYPWVADPQAGAPCLLTVRHILTLQDNPSSILACGNYRENWA